jgi:hypothetical protein
MVLSLFTIVTDLSNKDINFVFIMRYFGPFINNLTLGIIGKQRNRNKTPFVRCVG